MASRGLGTLTLDLAVRTGMFEQGLDKAGRALDKRAKEWERIGNKIGTGIGLALAAGLTTAVLAIRSTINEMDELSKASQKVGLPTEELSKLNYAAKLADVSLENLVTSLGRLTKAQASAIKETSQQARVFDALGIAIKDADGGLRNSKDVLEDFADRFKELDGSPEAIAAGIAIFGRSFQQLIPLLKDGGAGIRAAGDELEELGGVLSTEAGLQAEQFNDNLDRLKVGVKGLTLAVASDLLPRLVELTDNLVELSKDGERTADIANTIGNVFETVGGIIQFVGGYFDAFGNVVEGVTTGLIGFYEIALGIANLDWNRIKAGMKVAQEGADVAYYGDQESAERGRTTTLPTVTVVGSGSNSNVRRDALQRALAGPQKKGGSKKSGKSDAEREAEALLESYKRMEASYREQIALVGDVTEVERLRYELVNGEGKKFTEEQKATLLGLAAQKDAVDAANKQLEEGKTLTESLLLPFEQVNEERAKALQLLNDGIIGQETYTRALEASLTPAEQMLEDLAFETELLGKTREQQELLTAARLLGAEAATTQGQAAIQALKDFQEQAKATEEQIELMDGVRDAFGDFFTSIIDGSKSAKDALKDLVSDILAQITRLMVNKAIEQLFGAYGSTQGGQAGGWGQALASLFGGQRAAGGYVSPGKFYQVNENGSEMLSVGGKDYLMMGSQPGTVTPNHQITGKRMGDQYISFNVQGTADRRSRDQIAMDMRRQQLQAGARS